MVPEAHSDPTGGLWAQSRIPGSSEVGDRFPARRRSLGLKIDVFAGLPGFSAYFLAEESILEKLHLDYPTRLHRPGFRLLRL